MDAPIGPFSFRIPGPEPHEIFARIEGADVRGVHQLLEDELSCVSVRYPRLDDTPLHCAAEEGNVDIVRLLLQHGADINARDDWERTPLHKACEKLKHEVVRTLAAAGADVNSRDKWGESPLSKALYHGREGQAIVESLCAAGADIDLQAAVYLGTVDKCRTLIDNNRPSKEGLTHLLYHAFNAYLGLVDEPTWTGQSLTPSEMQTLNNHLVIGELLLQRGADPNTDEPAGHSLLTSACGIRADAAWVRLLIDHGADVNFGGSSGPSPLQSARESGNDSAIALLKEQGATD